MATDATDIVPPLVIQPDGKRFSVTHGDDVVSMVGGKDAAFKPAAEITKWGEKSIVFGVATTEIVTPVLDPQTGILTWTARDSDQKVNFYPLGKTEQYESGMEIELVLGSVPPSPNIPFFVDHDGLEFLYQPELIDNETVFGADRPRNVVGSMAIYAAGKRGGQYATGKHSHLYCPTATDANGNTINGVWQDDIKHNLLLAVFDPRWIADAVYPVVIGPTLGNTSIGGTFNVGITQYSICAGPFTMPANGTATQVNFYTAQASINTTFAIYGNTSGKPGSRIAQSAGGNLGASSAAWYSSAISAVLTSGTVYWIAMVKATVGSDCYFDSVAGEGAYNSDGTWTYSAGSMPDPFEASSIWHTRISMYLDYTVGGAIIPRRRGSFLSSHMR